MISDNPDDQAMMRVGSQAAMMGFGARGLMRGMKGAPAASPKPAAVEPPPIAKPKLVAPPAPEGAPGLPPGTPNPRTVPDSPPSMLDFSAAGPSESALIRNVPMDKTAPGRPSTIAGGGDTFPSKTTVDPAPRQMDTATRLASPVVPRDLNMLHPPKDAMFVPRGRLEALRSANTPKPSRVQWTGEAQPGLEPLAFDDILASASTPEELLNALRAGERIAPPPPAQSAPSPRPPRQ